VLVSDATSGTERVTDEGIRDQQEVQRASMTNSGGLWKAEGHTARMSFRYGPIPGQECPGYAWMFDLSE